MAQYAYPSPYPAYTETYLTPEGYSQGGAQMNDMAYYGGGPDPMQPCAPFSPQQIQHSGDVEVHRFDPMPPYNYVPTTSPTLYQPAAGSMGYGFQDPNMQTFCHSFGNEFAFYNTAGDNAMPQGYHVAMQGFPEAVATRKAIKKELKSPAAMTEDGDQQTKKGQHKRRSIGCC